MARLAVFIGRLQWIAFALLVSIGNQAIAEEKAEMKPPSDEVKVLVENDRFVVSEERLAPGAESESRARPYRVVRALKGGQIQRIYPDGRKELAVWKAGDVHIFEASGPYKLRNIGKGEIVFYIVGLK